MACCIVGGGPAGMMLGDLRAVQHHELPVRVTQRIQMLVQERIVRPVLGRTERIRPPGVLRTISRSPLLRRLVARMIGLGVRPEHVRI